MKTRMVLQVHDELCLRGCCKPKRKKWKSCARAEMEGVSSSTYLVVAGLAVSAPIWRDL